MRRLLLNVALASFSITLGLGTAELMVRVASPQLTYRFPRGLFVPDAAVAYRLTPGFSGQLDTPEYETDVEITPQGLRDDRVYAAKGDDEIRVLMLGDSFVMGVGVTLEETFVERVEDVLDRGIADKDLEIVNAGVAGYSTRQALAWFKRYGSSLDADLVLLGFFVGNDFSENAGQPLEVRDGYLVDGNLGGGMLPYRARRFLGLHSQLYHIVWPLQRRIRGYGHEENSAARDVASIYYADDTAATEQWRPTESALDELIQECRRLEMPFGVVIIPDHTQVVPSAWNTLIGQAGGADDRYSDSAPNRRLVELLNARNVPVLDLLPAFKAESRPSGLYLPLDKHWTTRGHEIAARATAPFVKKLLTSNVQLVHAERDPRPTSAAR